MKARALNYWQTMPHCKGSRDQLGEFPSRRASVLHLAQYTYLGTDAIKAGKACQHAKSEHVALEEIREFLMQLTGEKVVFELGVVKVGNKEYKN